MKVCRYKPNRTRKRVVTDKDACRFMRAAMANGASAGALVRCIAPADYCKILTLLSAANAASVIAAQVKNFLAAIAIGRLLGFLASMLGNMPKVRWVVVASGIVSLLAMNWEKVERLLDLAVVDYSDEIDAMRSLCND